MFIKNYQNKSVLVKTMQLAKVGAFFETVYIHRIVSLGEVLDSQSACLRGVYSDTTQLNSTSSCRHVHNVNNCHLSMNVVTQLTQFVGRDVINKNTTDLAVRCSTGSVELS